MTISLQTLGCLELRPGCYPLCPLNNMGLELFNYCATVFFLKKKKSKPFSFYVFMMFPCLYPATIENSIRLIGKSAPHLPPQNLDTFLGCQAYQGDPGSKPPTLGPTQPFRRAAEAPCFFSMKHSLICESQGPILPRGQFLGF